MKMIEYYKEVVFDNYFNFSTRARRSEYWYFILANFIIAIILTIIDKVLGIGILNNVYNIAVFVPTLAVAVRRLHDIGKSGSLILIFYALIGLLLLTMTLSGMTSPGIGFFGLLMVILGFSIWMIVLFCREGELGENNYGLDPKNEIDEIDEIGTIEA